MRIHRISLAALFLMLPLTASAQSPLLAVGQATTAGQKPEQKPPQTPPAKPAPAPAQPAEEEEVNTGWVGYTDFGVRGTSINGDPSRFERYRDMGDGLFMERLDVGRESRGWLFDLRGEHVGRTDQRYVGTAVKPGKVRGLFMYDQIPMVLSTQTQTLYTGIGTGVLQIDDPLQAIVQAAPNAIGPVFNQNAVVFETKTRRNIVNGGVEVTPTEHFTVTSNYRHTDRDGTIPFGGSFGHSSVVELPAPTEHTLNDFDASAEYVKDPLILRGGYTGSWFHNDVTSLTWDNPYRLQDITGTSGRGRLSMAQSNSFIGVNGMASVKLPYKSRAMAYVSVGMLQDVGDTLVPQTINSANATAPIERDTVEGEARTSSVNLRFTSRPTRWADVSVNYRSYDYDNKTPIFDMTQRVAYDNTPSNVSPAVETEPFGLTRHNFDADFRYTPTGGTSAGIGYSRYAEDRPFRIFHSTTENILRLTFDTLTRQYFSLRTKYEYGQKRGEGIEEGEEELAAIGEQPGMRHFDVANRDRNRITFIGSVTPTGSLNLDLSFAAGKDDYIGSEFGVRDNDHRIYGVGADYLVNENASVGFSYSFEKYNALQRSRQANDAVQFVDPSRNWAADTSDTSNSVLVNAEWNRIKEKFDVKLSYDFSRGRGKYNYITGPVADRTLPEEVIVPTTLPTPTELPPTLSEFHRGTLDLIYALTSRISIGASYWYDQYRVEDFTLDVEANPQLARGQALLMGYLYRPYTANTYWLRMLYRF
ncbi:MAG TPA: MtrB/PioB family decaheme-associated outer membrane protein [Vicinamibacterales bacterium]|nr:MtrB/PioB family decaheme-associated outer membrane protein [Vicinamibacterales bacterium]